LWLKIRSSDISWGTKGDNKVSTDLGVVTTGKNKNEVEVAVPMAETDINAAYEDAIHVISNKPPVIKSKPDPITEQEDYYRTFRTKWVDVDVCISVCIWLTTLTFPV
jgi:chitin synthase